jgi:hypothetical protein
MYWSNSRFLGKIFFVWRWGEGGGAIYMNLGVGIRKITHCIALFLTSNRKRKDFNSESPLSAPSIIKTLMIEARLIKSIALLLFACNLINISSFFRIESWHAIDKLCDLKNSKIRKETKFIVTVGNSVPKLYNCKIWTRMGILFLGHHLWCYSNFHNFAYFFRRKWEFNHFRYTNSI